MPDDTRKMLLKEISNLNTDEVVALLQKNELSECCAAVVKRQVDGQSLLQLSEGNLSLWKRDLTTSSRRSLCRFVEALNNNPIEYFQEKDRPSSPAPDESYPDSSESDYWATDFESDGEPSKSEGEDSVGSEMYRHGTTRPLSRTSPGIFGNGESHSPQEDDANGNMHSNGTSNNRTSTGSNHVTELKRRFQQQVEKPILGPKPKLTGEGLKVIESTRIEAMPPKQLMRPGIDFEQPKSDSINNVALPNGQRSEKYRPPIIPSPDKKPAIRLPEPPTKPPSWRKKNSESDDSDYEPIKQPIEPYIGPKPIGSTHGTQSPSRARSNQGSSESVHHLQNTSIVEDDQELYSSIPDETINGGEFQSEQKNKFSNAGLQTNDDMYLKPIGGLGLSRTLDTPPRRPVGRQLLGGLGSRLADEVADMIVRIKRGLLRCCHAQPSDSPELLEPPKPPAARRQASLSECLTKAALTQARENLAKRPEPKPFATYPTTSQTSRPLPHLPTVRVEPPKLNYDLPSYTKKPWYHNVGKEQAKALIEGASSKFPATPSDGYFLVRPSSAVKQSQPWTLVLWYKDRSYNIAVRERPDSRGKGTTYPVKGLVVPALGYALGSVKVNEMSFASLEEMIDYYKREELVLNSGNGNALQSGQTRLTKTPPKESN